MSARAFRAVRGLTAPRMRLVVAAQKRLLSVTAATEAPKRVISSAFLQLEEAVEIMDEDEDLTKCASEWVEKYEEKRERKRDLVKSRIESFSDILDGLEMNELEAAKWIKSQPQMTNRRLSELSPMALLLPAEWLRVPHIPALLNPPTTQEEAVEQGGARRMPWEANPILKFGLSGTALDEVERALRMPL
ncbi:MAG: hypothetical protein MHM6MM_007270, partial [Cercozoa sp. M6MM]